MKTQILLPHPAKRIGWILLIPATIAGIALAATGFDATWLETNVFAFFNEGFMATNETFTWIHTNVTNTLIGAWWLVGAMLVTFSKEKEEDEFIAEVRLSSLLWSVWINYILLLIAFVFIYGMSFMNVMIFNMFTVLIIFIIRFHIIMYKNSKTVADEK